jgi:orotate phosphoribosyltransferase-like protein
MGYPTLEEKEDLITKSCEKFKQGQSIQSVARELSISWQTAKNYKKLCADKRSMREPTQRIADCINSLIELNKLQGNLLQDIVDTSINDVNL